MKHESDKIQEVEIEDISLNFDEVYTKQYIPTDHLDDIKKANVLLLPNENFKGNKGYFFPECTEEVYQYLKENENDDINFDICSSDEDYKEIELHADVINIPLIIAQWIVIPTLTNMLASYLYDKIKNTFSDSKDVNTNINIIVEKKGKSKMIKYDGSIENFEKAMKNINETIFK